MPGNPPATSNIRASQPPPQPGAQTRPTTRQNPSQTKATKIELMRDPTSTVTNATDAKNYLKTHGLLVGKEPTTLAQLSHSLLYMAHSTSGKTLTEGIRAVAMMIDCESTAHLNKELSDVVAEKLGPLGTLAETVSEATKLLCAQADRLYRTCEEARDEIQKSTANLHDATNGATQGEMEASTNSNGTIANPNTYAAATARHLPPTHRHTLMRAENREKQILVDKDPGIENNNLTQLSELELLAKANEAIRQMAPDTEGQSMAKAVGAKKLNNGGVIYEMDSKETAQWVRDEKEAFMANFGGNAVLKERAVSVIVEYVPTTHSPDALAECRKIEEESNMPTNSLISTRWIKPAERRTPGQRSAHIIARFDTPMSANKAIEKGLIIAGKRVQVRRLKREPRRCLKCQLVNTRHMAADCKGVDTCGTCGKGHRTADCGETDPANFRCANCKEAGHASWDRFCPAFIAACQRMNSADPESTYRFFPSREQWTWEQTADSRPNNGGWDTGADENMGTFGNWGSFGNARGYSHGGYQEYALNSGKEREGGINRGRSTARRDGFNNSRERSREYGRQQPLGNQERRPTLRQTRLDDIQPRERPPSAHRPY